MNQNCPYNSITTPKKNFLSVILTHLFHDEPKNKHDLLKFIQNLKKNSLINNDILNMLEGVMHVIKERVRDIMVPRSQIITVQKNHSLENCLDIIIKSSHSRFPVVNEDKDYVEGILMAKDLLPFMRKNFNKNFSVEKILRPVIIVSEHKRVDRMLKEFRSQRYHMAIVIDEFGGMSGLITIEDILELIVGEIKNEHDDPESKNITQLTHNTFNVCALTPISNFNEMFHTNFKNTEIDTIGGFIMQSFGHLPNQGDSIKINKYIFKIMLTDSRRIVQMLVNVPEGIYVSLSNKKYK